MITPPSVPLLIVAPTSAPALITVCHVVLNAANHGSIRPMVAIPNDGEYRGSIQGDEAGVEQSPREEDRDTLRRHWAVVRHAGGLS